ncbi:MAG: MMPL family transporter [Flavobacteriales bacterium]|nr:MMPL family transporter [Flavobacteriales bacterium]
MWLTIARVILRYRAVFIWLILVSTYFMVQKSSDVSLSYSMARLLPKNSDPQLDYNLFVEKFGIKDNVMIIGVNSDNFFEIDNFQHWQSFADNIKSIPGVDEVYSITDAVDLKKSKQEKSLIVESLFENVSTQKSLDKTISKLQQLPFYDDRLINDSAMLMLVSLSNDYVTSGKRVKMINAITDFGDIYTSATQKEVKYSGLPYIRTVHSELIRKEVGLFIFLALLVTAIILFFFFRSVKVMMISMVVVGIGVVWSFGTLGILGYEITILTALIPPLLIVIGVPNCIFLINKYHNEFREHGNKSRSLVQMIRRVGNITILTNTTTALGFATFILTSSKDLRQFGLVASINIFAVFILSLLLIPIVFSYLNPPKKRHVSHLDRRWLNKLMQKITYFVTEKRTIVYATTITIISISLFGLLQMRIAGNITDDMPKESVLYKDIKFFEKHYKSVMPFEIIIDTHRKNGITKLSTLNRINKLTDTLMTYDEFSRPLSIIDPIKYSKQAIYNGEEQFYTLPNSQEKRWLLDYTLNSESPNQWIDALVDENQQIGRVSLYVTDIGTSRMKELKDELRLKIDQIFNPEKYKVILTGTSVVFLEGTTYLVKNLFISLFLAVLLISIFMAWMFNSFRMVVVSLIPNLIPLLITASIMGYFGISIKPSTILVFSIAFGISVDDTIHFLAKYRQELKYRNNNIKDSVVAAIKETGVSMFYTSIVLFFGFFIFIASQFGGTLALGLLVSITLLIALLSNLIVLPAMLLSLEKSLIEEAISDPLLDVFDEEEDIELKELTLKNDKE